MLAKMCNLCVIFGIVLVFTLAGCKDSPQRIDSVLIEEGGDRFVVSVFQLPVPMRIPSVYQPGDLKNEMKCYSWLKPFLFSRCGIDIFIPRKDWDDYAAFDWTEQVYADMTKKCEALRAIVLGKDKEYWAGVRCEITEVVQCESEKSRCLEIYLRGCAADGKKLGGEYHKLVDFQGRWKRTPDKDGGKLANQLKNCREKAMALIADGKLKPNPIDALR